MPGFEQPKLAWLDQGRFGYLLAFYAGYWNRGQPVTLGEPKNLRTFDTVTRFRSLQIDAF
jgi:hypothetical protein